MKPGKTTSDSVEEWVTWAFVGLCFLLSLLKDLFPLIEKGIPAALFAAIFLMLRQIRDLRVNLNRKGLDEDYYPTGQELYAAVIRELGRTQHEICATYFRDTPPSPVVGDEATRYFEKVVEFGKEKGVVRRIIKVTNPQLAHWCLEQAELAKELPRLHIKVLNPVADGVEPMNVIIFDGAVAYLSFAGVTPSQVGGVRPPGPRHTAFLQERFEKHWQLAEPIERYISTEHFRRLHQKLSLDDSGKV